MSEQHILLIEDEEPIRQMIRLMLTQSGYAVSEAENAGTGYQLAGTTNPDLILLDWMLPDMSGPDFLQRLRRDDSVQNIPVIMLTARGEENDMIRGLDAGADDYLAKPVSLKLLRARIQAQLRRAKRHTEDSTDDSHLITSQCLSLDLHAQEAITNSHEKISPRKHGSQKADFHSNEQRFTLGSSEFKVLQFFMQHPERVFSRAQLLDAIWGQNTFIEERTVDVHVMRLRKQLKQHGLDKCIQTVRGSGYRFSEQACKDEKL